MNSYIVEYNGQQIEFSPVTNYGGSEVVGLSFKCPKCQSNSQFAHSWIDIKSPGSHRIISAPDAPLSIQGSILCKTPRPDNSACGWHVFVTDGVARDA